MSDCLLNLSKYGVAFGEKTILRSIDLCIPDRGITVLLGPAGTGKSTLLRTICGLNNNNPSLRVWGDASFAGVELNDINQPVLVAQKTKLMLSNVLENVVYDLPERRSLTRMQQIDIANRLLDRANLVDLIDNLDKNVVDLSLATQRHLAIVRSAAANPRLLFLDEPTTGLDEKSCQTLIQYIKQESELRSILIVVHNQHHAKMLGGQVALLAGGWVHEQQATHDFFENPLSEAGDAFKRTGSCSVPSADAKPEELSDETNLKLKRPKLPKSANNYISDSFGPRNFLWLKKGILAGTPRPGLLTELSYDLTALKRVGVTVLVSLTTIPVDVEALSEYDIKGISFPIKDMESPSPEDAKDLCCQVAELLNQGEVVAMHCKAGLGRTGTMLATQLIYEGNTALEALESVRRVDPRWVQSENQVTFLESFFQWLQQQ